MKKFLTLFIILGITSCTNETIDSETISIDKGFLGFCVANGNYQILARTSTTLFLKTTYADENNAWFVLLGQE